METNMKFFLFFYILLMNYNNKVIARSPVDVCMSQGINIRAVHIMDYAPNLCNKEECNSECINMLSIDPLYLLWDGLTCLIFAKYWV
ncbi:hypothetical protein HanXRQr2_Chr15g0673451 [Helianthus annuus]|uniref:Uncharacterized protein n=1 Tax=Helianthus annuus TaxID=4232 RepID=A0A9K3DWF3_HELAN|nr:hypothetical protein HanXRQr2_Chr15g0673451 [Helianthus annuus]